MPTPAAARRHYRALTPILAAATVAIRRQWRAMQPKANWEQQWAVVGPAVAATVAASQKRAAEAAPPYVADLLAELGLAQQAAQAAVNPRMLAGVSSEGGDLASLLYGSVVHAGQTYNSGVSPSASLTAGREWLTEAVQTQIMDTARVATAVEMAANTPKTVTGYVRMVEPGACARCVVLAGKFYRWNTGFLRHPRCRCVHIPVTEDAEGDWRTNPNYYFDHLSTAEQDRVFGKSGAQAIRLGADVSQVVNARRGMSTTVIHGHPALVTTVGTTKRGMFGHLERKRGGQFAVASVRQQGFVKNYAVRRTQRFRLMPETILAEAKDRDDAVRLLRLYGFIF